MPKFMAAKRRLREPKYIPKVTPTVRKGTLVWKLDYLRFQFQRRHVLITV